MNWNMIGVIVAVLIALTGGVATLISSLVKNYFSTLSRRMDGFEKSLADHISQETAYQQTVTQLLSDMKNALTRIDTLSHSYVSTAAHLEALRKIDADITNARHAVRNELTVTINKVSVDFELEIQECKRRIENLEG